MVLAVVLVPGSGVGSSSLSDVQAPNAPTMNTTDNKIQDRWPSVENEEDNIMSERAEIEKKYDCAQSSGPSDNVGIT